MMPIDAVDDVAQGRVWTGSQALEIGLVDELGGLSVAIGQACRRVSVDPSEVRIRHMRIRPPLKQRIRQKIGLVVNIVSGRSSRIDSTSGSTDLVSSVLASHQLSFMAEIYNHPLQAMTILPECDQLNCTRYHND